MISKVSTLVIGMALLMVLLFAINLKCSSEPTTPQNLFLGITNTEGPIVCTLTESDLIVRKEEIKKMIFSKVTKKIEADNGYIFYFNDEEGLLPTLAEFIVEEQKCCKFFHYDLSIQSNGKGIALKISGPLGTKMMIESI